MWLDNPIVFWRVLSLITLSPLCTCFFPLYGKSNEDIVRSGFVWIDPLKLLSVSTQICGTVRHTWTCGQGWCKFWLVIIKLSSCWLGLNKNGIFNSQLNYLSFAAVKMVWWYRCCKNQLKMTKHIWRHIWVCDVNFICCSPRVWYSDFVDAA